jgi:hypothetical protein
VVRNITTIYDTVSLGLIYDRVFSAIKRGYYLYVACVFRGFIALQLHGLWNIYKHSILFQGPVH